MKLLNEIMKSNMKKCRLVLRLLKNGSSEGETLKIPKFKFLSKSIYASKKN